MIGFGISTYNRAAYALECIRAAWQFMPEDALLVVSDDCSTDGTRELVSVESLHYSKDRFILNVQPERSGISANKKALTDILLSVPEMEDIILIEDDVVPTRHDWWRMFTETARDACEAHLLYLPTLHKYGHQRRVTGQAPNQVAWKQYCSGMAMYFRASILRDIGTFDTRLEKYGWEHNELTARCLLAQAREPGGPYPHCINAELNRVFAAKDVDCETSGPEVRSSSGNAIERRMLAEKNFPLYDKLQRQYRMAYGKFYSWTAAQKLAKRESYFNGKAESNPTLFDRKLLRIGR